MSKILHVKQRPTISDSLEAIKNDVEMLESFDFGEKGLVDCDESSELEF